MLFKIALGNVRKSVRDYAVYFVTLVLGVCVFYAFNTIANQAGFLSKDMREMVKSIGILIRYVTVFLACVLGFLMVYANNYLVRRRKRELGLYQLLGCTRGQVSLILFFETIAASALSFLVGLGLGVLLSQLLVFVTAALFNDCVTNFSFMFSTDAALFTLFCFLLIFAVTLLFNLRALRKVKLIDLMGAHRQNESSRVRSLPASIVLGVIGIGLIGWSYVRLIHDGLPVGGGDEMPAFGVTTLMVTVGTVALCFALSGLLLYVGKAFRGSYLRGINTFTLRQISSRVNTVSASMAVVSMVLFLAITSMTGGLAICQSAMEAIRQNMPVDLYFNVRSDPQGTPPAGAPATPDIDAMLASRGMNVSDVSDTVLRMSYYESLPETGAVTVADVANSTGLPVPGVDYSSFTFGDYPIWFVKESEFNAQRRYLGLPEVSLGQSGYILTSNGSNTLKDFYRSALASGLTFTVGGEVLTPVESEPLVDRSAAMCGAVFNTGIVVVPDNLLEGARAAGSSLSCRYNVDAKAGDDWGAKADEALTDVIDETDSGTNFYTGHEFVTFTGQLEAAMGLSGIIAYLAVYIGFVLVIAVAAILAIQQLSGCADSAQNYRVLSELGCSRSMMSKSLFVQSLAFFLIPLVIAGCHSLVALGQVGLVVEETGIRSFDVALVPFVVALIGVYCAYFVVTYVTSRSVVLSNK